jgi:heme/copper-type cytochrome/quinol oxidase subunit 3
VGAAGIAAAGIAWLWPAPETAERTTETPFGTLPVGLSRWRSVAYWGMACVVATEASFFAYLLFSYFYLASMSTNAWPGGGAPELGLVAVNTAILLASSGVMLWAEAGARQGDRRRLEVGLGLTLALGVTFLVLQGVEYARSTFSPGTDAHGSLFFTITGFHGAHVFVGLVMLAVVLVRALRGHFAPDRHAAVSATALYWHFVDVVWLAVFTSLYLSPHFR